MQIRIKTTGFKLTEGLRSLAEDKLLVPVQKRLGSELSPDHILEVELAKITKHHVEGKIWKCEVNLSLPRAKRTVYATVLSESLEAAIDEAKDEIEREVGDFKNRRSARFLRVARKLKERVHIARLAQSASEFYRWFRKK